MGRSFSEENDNGPLKNFFRGKKIMDSIVDQEQLIHGNIKVAPGITYGLGKAHKENNCVRDITSGCGTALENLSIFVKRRLFPEFSKMESRSQDSSEILNFIDYLKNTNNIIAEDLLVTFDIATMFPSINNQSYLQHVKKALEVT